MKKKILCLLLSVLMLVGTLSVLTACGGGGDEDPCESGCARIDEDPKDAVCDNCGKAIRHEHKDTDGDDKCDLCKRNMKELGDEGDEFPTVEWIDDDPIDLYFMMSKNTDGQQNPSGCERYLAGEDLTVSDAIDDQVSRRNADAYEIVNVNVEYDYYDDVPKYGWGKNIDIILNEVRAGGTDAPDMYSNFTYDMVGASIKGAFANLKNKQIDMGNYFSFLNEGYDETVNNRGYMYEYMESVTLSQTQMYLLASDYFIDLIRSFYVVPVNIELLTRVGENITGDLNGDLAFTIDDFYQEVENKGWTYKKVMEYSDAIYSNTGKVNDGEDIEDVLGFVVYGGFVSSGIIYSTDITVIQKTPNAEGGYDYLYPESNSDQLFAIFDAVEALMGAEGVVCLSSANNSIPNLKNYGNSTADAVRNRFCDNQILFGSIIMLGALEYQVYQDLKDTSGFGVVPVPLYMENPGENDRYLTSIHNTARPGAISKNTDNFTACTAFLDYQSTHSTDILNEYYNYNLQYNVASGDEGTVKMLQYIRYNVRSAFDKTFEDAIGVYQAKPEVRWSHIMEVNQFDYGDEIRISFKSYTDEKNEYLKLLYAEYAKLPQ